MLQEDIDKNFNDIRKQTPEQNVKLNKKIENINKNQTEILDLKNTVTELKNSIESFNNRLEQAERESVNSKTD